MDRYILITLLGLIILQYITERWLSLMNRRLWSDELPPELSGIYDPAKYKLSQRYERDNDRFEIFTSTLSAAAMIILVWTGMLGKLNGFLAGRVEGSYLNALAFFAIIGLLADIAGTPFQLYSTFVIEQKYGFNKMTWKTFCLDKVKGWLVAAVLGGGVLCLILWIYSWSGNYFFLLAWMMIAAFSVFLNMFYSSLIVPLFNKQSPLEEGSLRQKIMDYASNAGFTLNNIFVLNGSKRSTKANAYFSGLGPKKRIVLFDTLIKEHTEDEIVAVLAHEMGHYKLKHTRKNMMLSLLESAVFLFLLSQLLHYQPMAVALGSNNPSFHLNLLGFALLYSPVSFATGLLSQYLSRKYEYQADRFATETFSGKTLGQALIKISVNHLSNLRPHPAYVFCYYSHPPLLLRLKAIQNTLQPNTNIEIFS